MRGTEYRLGEFPSNTRCPPVESARSEQGRVQCVGSVGGHDDFDVDGLIKSVHLIEELQEDTLDFSVGAGLSVESLRRDRVDLVDEDDG